MVDDLCDDRSVIIPGFIDQAFIDLLLEVLRVRIKLVIPVLFRAEFADTVFIFYVSFVSLIIVSGGNFLKFLLPVVRVIQRDDLYGTPLSGADLPLQDGLD